MNSVIGALLAAAKGFLPPPLRRLISILKQLWYAKRENEIRGSRDKRKGDKDKDA